MPTLLEHRTASAFCNTVAFRLFGRLFALLLLTACLVGTIGSPSEASAEEWSAFGDVPYLDSTEAIVVDGNGNVLYTLNANSPMAMASITKVMTAVVALESGVPLDTVFTITDSVTYLDPASSIINCQPGQTMTLWDLLWGLLVHSGNDAAVSIAECVAGSEEAFVDLMNDKAVALGLYDTHFANAHGLDAYGHYSTASDLVKLGRYAMENPVFASIVGSASREILIGYDAVTFDSTDAMLNVYPGMRGIKTGYTGNAGCAFLGTATRGGVTVYFAVLGAYNNDQRWGDVVRLLDWTFAHYSEEQLLSSSGNAMGHRACADHFGWSFSTTIGSDATRLTGGSEPVLEASSSATDDTLAEPGSAVGTVILASDGRVVTARSVQAAGLPQPTQTFGPFVSDIFYGVDVF